MRTAISPRFAAMIFWNGVSDCFDFLCIGKITHVDCTCACYFQGYSSHAKYPTQKNSTKTDKATHQTPTFAISSVSLTILIAYRLRPRLAVLGRPGLHPRTAWLPWLPNWRRLRRLPWILKPKGQLKVAFANVLRCILINLKHKYNSGRRILFYHMINSALPSRRSSDRWGRSA